MSTQHFLEVRILPARKSLQEFENTVEQPDQNRVRTRYIEVKQDTELAIQVTLHEGFDFKGADCIHYDVFIDNDPIPWNATILKDNKKQCRTGVLKITLICTLDHLPVLDDETGIWRDCSPKFTTLQLSESRFHCHSNRVSNFYPGSDADRTRSKLANIYKLNFFYRDRAT